MDGGDAFALEDGGQMVENGQSVGQQQPQKEFVKFFAKMETELKEAKQMCRIAQLKLENTTLQAELKQQKLIGELDELRAKMVKLEKEQQQKQRDEQGKYEILDRMEQLETKVEQQQEANGRIDRLLEQQNVLQTEFCAKIDELSAKFGQLEATQEENITKVNEKINANFVGLSNYIQTKVSELNEQQQDKLANCVDTLKEQFEIANAEQLAKVQNEIVEIGKWVKQQQQEKALLKFRMNFWDPSACHGDIEIVGNDRLTVRKKGNNSNIRSVLAKHPISLNKASDGIFYFEISIKEKKRCSLYLGFAFKRMGRLDRSIRACNGTYAWGSVDEFLINGSGKGSNGKYSFGVGDVVGIGVKLANRQMILTKNGLRLDASEFFVDPSSALDHLFPFVTLVSFGDEIEANFGPNFAFDLATL